MHPPAQRFGSRSTPRSVQQTTDQRIGSPSLAVRCICRFRSSAWTGPGCAELRRGNGPFFSNPFADRYVSPCIEVTWAPRSGWIVVAVESVRWKSAGEVEILRIPVERCTACLTLLGPVQRLVRADITGLFGGSTR